MGDHKDRLLKHLSAAGWEQVESMPVTRWWGDEIWRVRSVTINWGFELFLSFMFYQHPGAPKEIWQVDLTVEDPCENSGVTKCGSIATRERDMLRELPEFLDMMNRLRSNESEMDNSGS